MSKHKAIIHMNPGEAYLVAPYEYFRYIVDIFNLLAETEEDLETRESLIAFGQAVAEEVEHTYVPLEEEDEIG